MVVVVACGCGVGTYIYRESGGVGSGTLITRSELGIALLLGEIEKFFSHPLN